MSEVPPATSIWPSSDSLHLPVFVDTMISNAIWTTAVVANVVLKAREER